MDKRNKNLSVLKSIINGIKSFGTIADSTKREYQYLKDGTKAVQSDWEQVLPWLKKQ